MGDKLKPEGDVAPDKSVDAVSSVSSVAEARRRRGRAARMFVLALILTLLPVGWWITSDLPVQLRACLFVAWTLLFLLVPDRSPFPLLHQSASALEEETRAAIARLSESEDPASIGPLIDAEALADAEQKVGIRSALTRLLPRAGELGDVRLTEEQLERLYTHLDAFGRLSIYASTPTVHWSAYPLGGTWDRARIITESFPELTDEYLDYLDAVIRGLVLLGNEGTTRYLESLLRAQPKTAQIERIQATAWVALDLLHDRLERERVGTTLLRPTVRPAGTLVMPVANPSMSGPESLLRVDDDS